MKLFHFQKQPARRCSVKKVFLEISQNSQENTCARISFSIKLQASDLKETLAQVLFCEFSEISNNTFFYRAPPVTASVFSCLHSYYYNILQFRIHLRQQKAMFV